MKYALTTPWLYVIAFVSGFAQALAFDIPFDSANTWLAPLLSFFSLLVFLSIVVRLPLKRGLLFGYCFGLTYLGWGLNWVYISMANYGKAPLAFAVAANISVIAYLALYWLLAAFFIIRLGKTPNQRLLLAAPVIALLEWVRSVFLIGFPWLSLGYAWIDSPIARLASLGGVFFLSFTVLLCTGLCLLDLRRLQKSLLLIGMLILFIVLSLPPGRDKPVANSISIALIQGNMPVITAYNAARMNKNLLQYQQLTERVIAEKKGIDAVIWAEAAIPYFYQDAKVFLNDIHQLQQKKQFDLISGLAYFADGHYYNSLLLQSAKDNQSPAFYHKHHLLPFGEYLPLRGVLDFFKDYVEIPMADFSRGDLRQTPFTVSLNRFSPSICFEVVFGDEIRQNAKRADILLNISNDAWFDKSKAQRQHLNIARMRAVENQKYLVRATNNGITAVIAPNGKVEKSIPPFQAGTLIATVTGNDRPTLYSKIGDTPYLLLFTMWLFAVCLYSMIVSRRHATVGASAKV